MTRVVLEPGWLARDVRIAAKRVEQWDRERKALGG